MKGTLRGGAGDIGGGEGDDHWPGDLAGAQGDVLEFGVLDGPEAEDQADGFVGREVEIPGGGPWAGAEFVAGVADAPRCPAGGVEEDEEARGFDERRSGG